MNREQAVNLNNALQAQGLKVKHLSGDNYVKLLAIKRPLAKHVEDMGKDENELFESYGLVVINGSVNFDEYTDKMKDKSFSDKLKAIRSKEFEPKELKFIEADVFKKFTDDVDFGVASVLAEYLLKE